MTDVFLEFEKQPTITTLLNSVIKIIGHISAQVYSINKSKLKAYLSTNPELERSVLYYIASRLCASMLLYSSIHLFIHSFIRSFIHSFIQIETRTTKSRNPRRHFRIIRTI